MKQTLLCIHGWPMSASSYKRFGDAVSDLQVVSPNLPGFGGTPDHGFEHSLSSYADFICDIAEDLDGEIHLLGHSMGGKISMLIASRQPTWLKSLLLLAPSYPDATIVPERVLESQLDAYGKPDALKTMFHHWANNVDMLVDAALLSTPDAYAAWLTRGRPMDIGSHVSKIDVPTLVLHGDIDPLRTVDDIKTRVINRIQNAELCVVQGASHCVQMDQPHETTLVLREWLARQSG